MQDHIIKNAKKECGYFKDADGEECYQFNNAELMRFVASVIIHIADLQFRDTCCIASRRPLYRETINEELKELACMATNVV
jgi:hypothetical protein